MDKLRVLELAVPDDVMTFDLTAGQRRLLLAALDKLKPAANAEMPGTSASGQASGTDTETAELVADSGKTFHDLLQEVREVTDSVPDRVPDQSEKSMPSDFLFDPRHILTTKATSKKAVHITAFLSEKTKRRRLSRRKELVLSSSGNKDDTLVLKTDDEHPYAGIYLEEWGAANCRVMHHLLKKGDLSASDVSYYLAYTTQIFEFASKYEWNSVLDFDYWYREIQAEHSFKWGTFSSHLELHLLIPRTRQNSTPTTSTQTRHKSAAGQKSTVPDCRMYKATGSCTFGASCRFRHVREFHSDNVDTGKTAKKTTGDAMSKN